MASKWRPKWWVRRQRSPDERQQRILYWSTVAQASAAVIGLMVGIAATALSVVVYQSTVEHDEVEISPYLDFEWDADRTSMYLVNLGPGHAIIKTTTASFGDEEIVMGGGVDEEDARQQYLGRMFELANRELTGRIELPEEADGEPVVAVIGSVPDVDERLLNDKRFRLFGLVNLQNRLPGAWGTYMRYLDVIGRPANEFDMRVCFCSVTERSCFVRTMTSVRQDRVSDCN